MNVPQVQQLSTDLCVAPQLDADAMAWAAKSGFKSVVNNRPDFEGGPDQPTSAVIEAAAKAAGLQYAWLPVLPAVQTPQEIARFAALLAELPKPILAFCRTGTRSGKLYRAATEG
ncbi:MAG TPA: TIGR01244 family sulfur transferase [Burkholderiaceae bacterium]|nr:TIGR01244 family sulfur transferase [Burkholderiaceae bacterium]